MICIWAVPGHDVCAYVYYDDKTYYLPFANFFDLKHYDFRYHSQDSTINDVLDEIQKQFGIENDYDTFLIRGGMYIKRGDDRAWFPSVDKQIFERTRRELNLTGAGDMRQVKHENLFVSEIENFKHHDAHAICGYVQSPFKKSLVMTYDGTGDAEVAGLYSFNEENYFRYYDKHYDDFNVVGFYSQVGQFLPTICKSFGKEYDDIADLIYRLSKEQLDYAGKLMGLSAYGKKFDRKTEELYDELRNLYRVAKFSYLISYYKPTHIQLNEHLENERDKKAWRFLRIKGLINAIIQQKDEDIAYMYQRTFESEVISHVCENLERIKEHDNNLVLSGGGALNVLANEKIKEVFPWINVYVPPNPGDEGLGLGFISYYLREQNGYWPKFKVNQNLLGPLVHDFDEVDLIIGQRSHKVIDIFELVDILKKGEIVGLIQERLEIGPRALGFRSILCDPSFPDMKDKLNSKVKFREWFRPFAPVCNKEDASTYFESNNFENLECMSFAPVVKEEYREKLSSITHVDNTSRLQTVTREENSLLHHILKVFDGVLLNTSLNVQGKPICNRLSDGLKVLDNTGLDHLVILHNNRLYCFE